MDRKFGLGSIFLILLAVSLLLVVSYRRNRPAPSPQEPEIIFSTLTKNEYEPDGFSRDGEFIYYGESLLGVDVSAHQMQIDWEQVRQAGVDFAVIRAAYRGYTNGGLNMDPYFLQNLQGAKDAGLQVGVYLFSQAITVEEAREEAEFLLECLDGAALDLPVYFDWETVDAEARTNSITGDEVTSFAQEFCRTVTEAGYDAGVYFNTSMGYFSLILPDLEQYEFWLAQYEDVPDFYYDFAMWQYTADGTVAGISVPVDLNVRFVK